MVKKEVLAKLIDAKKSAILKTVLNSSEEMYLKEVSTKASVPLTTTFRILQELVDLEILERREWKTSKVYSCRKNEKVRFLQELFAEEFNGLQEFKDRVAEFHGISHVVERGKRSKTSANVILIGEYINTSRVEEVCRTLREERGFQVSFVTLTQKQFDQMKNMGL